MVRQFGDGTGGPRNPQATQSSVMSLRYTLSSSQSASDALVRHRLVLRFLRHLIAGSHQLPQ